MRTPYCNAFQIKMDLRNIERLSMSASIVAAKGNVREKHAKTIEWSRERSIIVCEKKNIEIIQRERMLVKCESKIIVYGGTTYVMLQVIRANATKSAIGWSEPKPSCGAPLVKEQPQVRKGQTLFPLVTTLLITIKDMLNVTIEDASIEISAKSTFKYFNVFRHRVSHFEQLTRKGELRGTSTWQRRSRRQEAQRSASVDGLSKLGADAHVIPLSRINLKDPIVMLQKI